MKHLFKIFGKVGITITLIVIVMSLFFVSCNHKKENLVDITFDPELTPTMDTDSVVTLISDSGITRYKLETKNWKVFDKAKEPYWYFPQGIYLERFDQNLNVEARINADTAWNYTEKRLWHLKGHVDIRNMKDERFRSEELFWDQRLGRVYSDKYIEIETGDGGEKKLKGYGFESNQEMTDYKIFRVHDGKFPVEDDVEGNAL